MLKTSYFSKSAQEPGAVSIARFPPKWYTGARCLPLAPTAGMIRIMDWHEYRLRYHDEILSMPGPDEVLRDPGVNRSDHDILLLCFEKWRADCHRGLVAVWLRETRGIGVLELGDESVTLVPV
jgi:hypothetical protein